MSQQKIHGTILAFDFGSRYIGVAVGQTVTHTASALDHLKTRDGGPPWEQIEALLQQWQPQLVVVGLPLNMDGSESEMSRRARRFGNRVNGRFGVAVVCQDERLSSYEAKSRQPENSSKRNHGGAIDCIAETVILEHWLQEQAG
jgi:putative Holliday junction resolvase